METLTFLGSALPFLGSALTFLGSTMLGRTVRSPGGGVVKRSAESECTVAKKLKLAQASETVGSGSGSSSEGAVLPLQAGWLAKRCMAPTILSCAAASELAQQVHDALKDAVAAAPLHLTHSRARARKAAVRARSRVGSRLLDQTRLAGGCPQTQCGWPREYQAGPSCLSAASRSFAR